MKAPYLPLYAMDWLCSRKILAMPAPAVKAYVYLLCESWRQTPRATLPNNDTEIMDMARCGEATWILIKDIVMERFVLGKNDRFEAKFLYEQSLKNLSNQRFKNKNAVKTRPKRHKNAALEDENEDEIETATGIENS